MRIWLLNPFDGGSHAQWARGYTDFSQHQVEIFALPGRYWKWRMHGAALTLAERCLGKSSKPDLILATDMLDLSSFCGLTRHRLSGVPIVLYMHENQLTYPWSPDDPDPGLQRDQHYGFINYQSALTADAVWFNSAYHKRSFLAALRAYLKRLPDHQDMHRVDEIEAKSLVMPVGLDLHGLGEFQPKKDIRPHNEPWLLWNHRWEYDKGPEDFFQALFKLKAEGFPFRLILLGEQYRKSPTIFADAQTRLQTEILHAGFVPDRATFAQWLWQADLLPVTARHDFFGVSTIEAIHCGVQPLLPNRLAYPEHVATGDLYANEMPLDKAIRKAWAVGPGDREARRLRVAGYDWRQMAPRYDKGIEALVRDSLTS